LGQKSADCINTAPPCHSRSRHHALIHRPRSIAVIGAGRVGSAFAYQFARAGHGVTVVARLGSNRLAQLRRDGGILRDTGEKARVTVADSLDTARPYDLVIVTVLAHQVDAVLPEIQASRARQVHFMFVTPSTSGSPPPR
jgi:2-dehydropantoate 2-reductase